MGMTGAQIGESNDRDLKSAIAVFERRAPEIVFEWADRETDARGWAVINSLRGGAAGGGTRMRKGLDRNEVAALAKTMEVKFTISGPPIGGAKSGINFDPRDPRRAGVLQRWFAAVSPLLHSYYGTGGDLNVDELADVIPLTEGVGLWHPQQGIVRGHFGVSTGQRVARLSRLRDGLVGRVDDARYAPAHPGRHSVADLITGWGVAEAARHFYEIFGGALAGKSVIVQGWGNVGASAAYYAARSGARIVGIIDRQGGLMDNDGLPFEVVRELFLNKTNNTLVSDRLIPADEINTRIWDMGAEIFLPCAASRLLTLEQTERMMRSGLELIVPGANVPFADTATLYGTTYAHADTKVSVVPDFIANCGMARALAHLMAADHLPSPSSIFDDVSQTIFDAIDSCHAHSRARTGVARTALHIALQRLL